MKILETRVDSYDIEELACKVLGLDYDKIDADTEKIEDKINEEFFIDLETFQRIVERLMPLVEKQKSDLTSTMLKGFADIENRTWLVKTEVSN
mgnify:CR=1 FL=1